MLLTDALSQAIFEERLVFDAFGVFDNPFLVTGELLPGIYTLTVSTRTRVWTDETTTSSATFRFEIEVIGVGTDLCAFGRAAHAYVAKTFSWDEVARAYARVLTGAG